MTECAHLDSVEIVDLPDEIAETDHPIIRSAEPGETWSWCYPDELMFELRAE